VVHEEGGASTMSGDTYLVGPGSYDMDRWVLSMRLHSQQASANGEREVGGRERGL
jgi:hypothetical protein